jgi:hypothetical protein
MDDIVTVVHKSKPSKGFTIPSPPPLDMENIKKKAIFKFLLRRDLAHKRYAQLNYLHELRCGYSKGYALRCLKRELRLQ